MTPLQERRIAHVRYHVELLRLRHEPPRYLPEKARIPRSWITAALAAIDRLADADGLGNDALEERIHDAESQLARLVLEALMRSELGYRLQQRCRGEARARKARAGALPAWMVDLFERAYATLDADCRARIGRTLLAGKAWNLAGSTHPHRAEITEYRAALYLKDRPKRRPTP